jgi:uncharacterized OB-fold protein
MTLEVIPIGRCRPYPPRVSAFTARFWNSLAQGRFMSTWCNACRRFTFPPKPHCPVCWSSEVEWKELGGRGRLYSYTINYAPPRGMIVEAPYAIGIIDLDEQVRLMCRVIDAPEAHHIDSPVRLVTLAYEDGPLFAVRIERLEPNAAAPACAV